MSRPCNRWALLRLLPVHAHRSFYYTEIGTRFLGIRRHGAGGDGVVWIDGHLIDGRRQQVEPFRFIGAKNLVLMRATRPHLHLSNKSTDEFVKDININQIAEIISTPINLPLMKAEDRQSISRWLMMTMMAMTIDLKCCIQWRLYNLTII